MKLNELDAPTIGEELSRIAHNNRYSKIFCKIPKWVAPLFYSNGFIQEASIPRFYNNREDSFFVSKFLSSDRLLDIENEKLKTFSNLLHDSHKETYKKRDISRFLIRPLQNTDVEQIAAIYREIFISYPFPIHEPEYIKNSMQEDVMYFGAEQKGKLVAVASSEIDSKGMNAEMTDFATHKAYQGNNLASLLLETMEKEMQKQGIRTVYTIARLNSIPMNKTFLRADYNYAGTLIKNTNIAGNIESMNVLYKHL